MENLQNNVASETTPAAVVAAADPAAVPAAVGKVEDLKRVYFPPDQREGALAAIEKARTIAAGLKLPIAFNWNAEGGETLPDGYGYAIVPIPQRREGQGNVIVGLHIAGIPSPETILADSEAGQKWAGDALVKALLNKYSNAVRIRDGQTGTPTAPLSVADFITNQTRDGGLSFFREIAPSYVKALKAKGLKLMNAPLLKQVLASSQFADQTFPKIPTAIWEGILSRMKDTATKENKEPGIVEVWQETRDKATFATADFGLEDLDDLFATEDDAEVATATPDTAAPATV